MGAGVTRGVWDGAGIEGLRRRAGESVAGLGRGEYGLARRGVFAARMAPAAERRRRRQRMVATMVGLGYGNSTAVCSYFLVVSKPYSSADVLCRFINERFGPGFNCAGELFAPKHVTARAARSKAGFGVDAQHARPGAFMQTWQARACTGKYCGSMLMHFQLPNERLPTLFSTGCSVRSVFLERTNRTAAYLEFRQKGAASGSGWSSMPYERFSQMYDEWRRRFDQASGSSPTLHLTSEAVLALAADPSPAASSAEAATLHSLSSFLGATTIKHSSKKAKPGKQATQQQQQQQKLEAVASDGSVLSVAGAKAATHAKDELATIQRNRRSRAVLLTATTAFAATCLSGVCFALGVAVGQRHAGGGASGRRLDTIAELPDIPT